VIGSELQRNQPGESDVARCAAAVFLCDRQLKEDPDAFAHQIDSFNDLAQR
jgi:hypothetical protein